MTEPRTDPRIGVTLDGRYRLDARIADGGMSTVYRAMDTRLHRTVAVKVLHAHMASDPVVLERFAAEAIISSDLNHPNIVGVRDHHVSGDAAYLVMEYVRGLNLREVLAERGRFTPRQTLAVLQAICTGLSVAHAEGIVHRDMKPANVLISDEGRVKVTDFGLARAASAHTNATTFFGTAAYISPELAVGDPADERSDIYAVGIIAYELLTGQQPFSSESAYGLAFKHINDRVPAPSALVPGLSPELDELVAYCTNKDPEDRPQDASFLLSDIKQIQQSLSREQLDLDAETLGGISDLIPPAGAPQTTVHDRLAQAQLFRSSAAEGAAAAAPVGAEGDADAQAPHADATAAFPHSAMDTTQAMTPGFPDAASFADDRTQAMGQPAPETTLLHSHPDHTSVLSTGQGPAAGNTGQLAAVPGPGQRPPSVRQAKKEARAAELAWKKEAQIPTHQLAPKSSAGRKWLVAVLLAVLAAAIVAAGLFFGMGPGAPFTVPTLTGMSRAEAISQLESQGVSASSRDVFDEKIERGLVVGSDPVAGETIRRFQGLRLDISKGPELFAVPNLTGRKQADAEKDLTEANLAPGKVSRKYSEEVDKGVVISHSPGTGEKVRRNSAVALVVSRGPAPVDVPNIVGMKESKAKSTLKDAGLKGAEDSKAYSRTVPEGSVVSQKPAGGTAERGSTVGYVLSRGPRMVEVPNVQGQQVDEAKAALEALGFKVDVEEFLGGFFGTVRSQTPAGGTAPEGSTVKLVVV
ncbi:protein kinase domain-containing protein [Paeniglutamicibacter sp. R2-26]|uniref:Stk1 family PASTA domain-containing Ser/Thr kinase n=1 Tax=Paeniglutamicibacter sp. R2-26 TaxID=3144417 RepID=UPI003EE7F9F6